MTVNNKFKSFLALSFFCSFTIGMFKTPGVNATSSSAKYKRASFDPRSSISPATNSTSNQTLQALYTTIYNSTLVDCTPFIPRKVYQAMASVNLSNSSIQTTIPHNYLYECLSSIRYDKDIPAYFFVSPFDYDYDNLMSWPFFMAVSELVSFSSEGTLVLKVNINFGWSETRLRWNLSSSINQFKWPTGTIMPVTKLYVPIMEVLNCPLDDCRLEPPNSTFVQLTSEGYTWLVMSNLIGAKCPLNFK